MESGIENLYNSQHINELLPYCINNENVIKKTSADSIDKINDNDKEIFKNSNHLLQKLKKYYNKNNKSN